MYVIGAGLGRTGTLTLRTALDILGFGPCHHMQVVLENPSHHVPLWSAALDGQPDWDAIYAGQKSAVDWPTASFYRELHAAYPEARFILTHRDPATWADSFEETIYTAMAGRDQAPREVQPWLDMCIRVIERAGLPLGLDKHELAARFVAHNEAVKAAIPASQLLQFEVRDGWGPLCEFLGVLEPAEAFPRTNDRAMFWELVNSGTEKLT
jgi:hypothetical protein